MVTQDEYHGYWLPDISVKYDPQLWLSIRGSYTSTLAYPDFNQIIPREDVSSNSGHYVVWNNYALRPAHSQNYDFQVAVYDNNVGLFAVSPFLKRIDDQIFSQQRTSPILPSILGYPAIQRHIHSLPISIIRTGLMSGELNPSGRRIFGIYPIP